MTKKLISYVFLIIFFTTHIFSIEPDVFVQSTVNRASKLLSENLTKDE